jgi:hypothetical protein
MKRYKNNYTDIANKFLLLFALKREKLTKQQKILRSQNDLSKREGHILEVCQKYNDDGKVQGSTIHITSGTDW